MKIQVDTAADTVPDIRNVITLLVEHLAMRGAGQISHSLQLPHGVPMPPGVPMLPTPVMLPPSSIPPPPPAPLVLDEKAFVGNVPPPPPAVQIPPPPSVAVNGTGADAAAATPSTDTAPLSATAIASPSDGPVELDVNGLPWDARIHSEARKKNADNSWRYRRNLADDVKSSVTSELRVRYPQAAPAAAPVIPPPPPSVSLPAAPAAVAPPPPAQVIPPPPPAAAGAVSPSQPVGVQPGASQVPVTDFKGLMAKAGALMQAGKLTHPMLAQACIACGVASLPALMSAPDKIPAVNAWLDTNVPA